MWDDDDAYSSDEPVVAPRFRRDWIRRAREEDAPSIVDLDADETYGLSADQRKARQSKRIAHWQNVLRGEAAGPTAEVWVAEEDGKLVGFAHCNVAGDRLSQTAQVVAMRVDYYESGRGIAEFLLRGCLRLAQRHGVRLLSVVTRVDAYGDDDVVSAARRLGFHLVYVGPVARGGAVTAGGVFVKDVMTADEARRQSDDAKRRE